jgi:hypothetical protein
MLVFENLSWGPRGPQWNVWNVDLPDSPAYFVFVFSRWNFYSWDKKFFGGGGLTPWPLKIFGESLNAEIGWDTSESCKSWENWNFAARGSVAPTASFSDVYCDWRLTWWATWRPYAIAPTAIAPLVLFALMSSSHLQTCFFQVTLSCLISTIIRISTACLEVVTNSWCYQEV